MSYREQLMDLALDHHGLVTTNDAARIGVPAVEVRKLASRRFLERLGYGVYRVSLLPRDSETEFAEAVALVGPDAYLRADAVLALLDLAPVNPRALRIGTRHRVRKALPPTIKVTWEPVDRPLTEHHGIRSTTVSDAILDSVGLVMTDRLLAAVDTAHARGLIRPGERTRLRRELRAQTASDGGDSRRFSIPTIAVDREAPLHDGQPLHRSTIERSCASPRGERRGP